MHALWYTTAYQHTAKGERMSITIGGVEYITVAELADIMKVNARTARAFLARHGIEGRFVGRFKYYGMPDIAAAMQATDTGNVRTTTSPAGGTEGGNESS